MSTHPSQGSDAELIIDEVRRGELIIVNTGRPADRRTSMINSASKRSTMINTTRIAPNGPPDAELIIAEVRYFELIIVNAERPVHHHTLMINSAPGPRTMINSTQIARKAPPDAELIIAKPAATS